MKNKLFWPIVIISLVIIVESILLISNNKSKNQVVVEEQTPVVSEVVKAEPVIEFTWIDEGSKKILEMRTKKTVAIDAIDLYISYKGATINSADNVGDLPKPSFSKISTEKSLVVMNYLISEAEGFSIASDQVVRVAELDITPLEGVSPELSIDSKTQVVENGTAKVLPY